MIKLLCTANVDLDAPTDDGTRPIHIAAQYGWVDCITLMEDRGCNIEIVNHKGEGALWFR